MEIMTANRRIRAAAIIGNTAAREKWLSIGIILTVTGAVVISLLPPLVLGKIIDRIAGGNFPGFSMAAEYFLLIFLSGALESLRESFLTVFGQKMTHAFRSELSKKLVPFESTNFLWKRNLIQQILDQSKWTEKTTHQSSQDRAYENQKSDYIIGKFKVPASNHGL